MNVEKYVINGGSPLRGEVEISGAKNAAVAIIPAALLVDGVCRIENIPQISDADMLLTILSHLGSKVRFINRTTIEIDSSAARCVDAPFDLTRKIRASYYLIGAMLKERFFAGGLPETPHDALTVLRDRIYRFGAKYAPSDFLRRLTGNAIPDPAPFLLYLREKHLGEAK